MDRYEGRMKFNNAVKIVSLLIIVALCFASVSMFVEDGRKDPAVSIDRIGDNEYKVTLAYDRDMAGGRVNVVVTDGDRTFSGDITVKPDSDDRHIVTGTFRVKGELTEPHPAVYGYNTNVYSQDQTIRFALAVVVFMPLILISALVTVRAFTTSVRNYIIDGRTVTVYCGIIRHELSVDGAVPGRMNTYLPFMTAHMEHMTENGTVRADVSMMNVPTVSFNGYIVNETESSVRTETI